MVQLCDFIDFYVLAVDPQNPFGQLRFASLTLHGRCYKCSCDPTDEPSMESSFRNIHHQMMHCSTTRVLRAALTVSKTFTCVNIRLH